MKRYNGLVLAVLGLGLLLLVVGDLLGILAGIMESLGTEDGTSEESGSSNITSLLLADEAVNASLLGRVELDETADLGLGVGTLGLAGVDDNDREEDLTLLLALDGVEIEASTESMSLGGEDLVERDGGEGDGLIEAGLLIEDLEVKGLVLLGVVVGELQSLVPGSLLTGVLEGLGLCGVLAVEAEGDAGIGVVLAETLDVLEVVSLVNGNLENVGHVWL